MIATLIGRRLLGYTIYELKLVRRGIDWARVRKPRPFARVRVQTVQRDPEFVASALEPIRDIAPRLEHSPEFVIPVVEDGRFVGMLSASDVAGALLTHPDMAAGKLAQPAAFLLRREDTLEQAAVAMADPHTPLLPVIDRESGRLLGILSSQRSSPCRVLGYHSQFNFRVVPQPCPETTARNFGTPERS